jgi:hypothetical protein
MEDQDPVVMMLCLYLLLSPVSVPTIETGLTLIS